MAHFSPKQSFLGIDIGTSSIKLVQLGDDNGRPRLMTYGYSEQTNDVVKSEAESSRRGGRRCIKIDSPGSAINLDESRGRLAELHRLQLDHQFAVDEPKELNSAVRWEAKKFVPLPIDELVLDWKLLKEPPGAPAEAGRAPKNLRVLITAAPRSLRDRYSLIFKEAGLTLVALDTEAFALERSLIGTDAAPVMIVDIGAVATDIAVMVDGIPLINRSIDVGGNTITKSIAQSLNIDPDRADQFKRDFGISAGQSSVSQIPKTIEFVVSQIINEIRFVLNLYRSQGSSPIEKIVLAGGSAFLLNLPEYLEKTLSMKTFIGDPWARIVYPLELKPALQEIGPRYAVAIGLAMRQIVS